MRKSKDVDRYISRYPTKTQKNLKQLRATIQKAAPKAEEFISYGMPAYKLNGRLVYFAAHSKHISLYPRPSGAPALRKELSAYKGSKGTIKFPLDKPLPLGLITKVVKFKVRQNLQRVKAKGAR